MSIAEANINGTPAAAPVHEGLLQQIEQKLAGDNNKVITIMEAIARDCLKGLSLVQTYLPAATTLAEAIFPAETASIAGATGVITLIQNAVATVEAKWAAGNESSKNGAQKLADVLSLVGPTVTETLTSLGVKVDSSYVARLVNIVVSILNIRTTGAAATRA